MADIKTMVDKTNGTLAGIKAVAPNYKGGHHVPWGTQCKKTM